MNDIYRKALKLNPKHTYKKIESVWQQTKDDDFDLYTYEEYNTENELIQTFRVKESIKLYPPFIRTISLYVNIT